MKVIALDPGGTTGWCTYENQEIVNPDGETEVYDERWVHGHLGPEEHHGQLYDFLGMQHSQQETYVVCESFEFRQKARTGLVLVSLEYIGVTKLFVRERRLQLKMQTAAMGKGFVTDEKLRKMGLYQPGWKHANDATRHLVYYLVNSHKRMDLIKSW